MMNDPIATAAARRTPTAEELRTAFAEFAQASALLSVDYGSLEARVSRLTSELRDSRAQRIGDLEAQERLAARLQNVLDALPAGLIVLNLEGRVQQFNPAAAALLDGLRVDAAWAGIVARNIAPRWDDGHDITLKSGHRVNISTQSLSREPGQIVLVKDVSETRQLQERLHLHKRLSANTEMAATLAHQLRTPLATALLSAAQLVHGSDGATRVSADRVRAALRQLERLIEDVLLFTRGGELGAQSIGADELLADLRAAIAEMQLPPGFAVRVNDDPRPASLALNRDAVLSIMLNLVHNAVQACAGRGELAITARVDGSLLCFRFADTGPGVDPARAEQIFEPFVTTRAGGTGMGLAVARSVARAHGGELSLDPNHRPGAAFDLRLPLRETRAAEPCPAAHSGIGAAG